MLFYSQKEKTGGYNDEKQEAQDLSTLSYDDHPLPLPYRKYRRTYSSHSRKAYSYL